MWVLRLISDTLSTKKQLITNLNPVEMWLCKVVIDWYWLCRCGNFQFRLLQNANGITFAKCFKFRDFLRPQNTHMWALWVNREIAISAYEEIEEKINKLSSIVVGLCNFYFSSPVMCVCLLTWNRLMRCDTAAAAVYMIMCGSFKGKEEANDVMETNIIKCR